VTRYITLAEYLWLAEQVTAGDVPANAQEALRRGGVAANPRGYAAIYAPGLVSWMTLDG
jgi:hypothetical protein